MIERGRSSSGPVASPARPLQSPPEVGRIEDRDPLDSTQRKEIGVAELFKHLGTTQDVVDFSDAGFGQQENEAVATPCPVDPCGQGLGAGKGAAQENLRVKNDSEPGQRGRPRRSQLQPWSQEDRTGLVHAR